MDGVEVAMALVALRIAILAIQNRISETEDVHVINLIPAELSS